MEDDYEIPDETTEDQEKEEDLLPEEDLPPESALQNEQPPTTIRTCNPRIDDLSQPNKRIFLALWNEHAYHLPEDKLENLKNTLKQLFAMSPTESAKYFMELKAETQKRAEQREAKKKIREFLINKLRKEGKHKAYNLFERILRCVIEYAVENPVPPVVSLGLRNLSDICLNELCNLKAVQVPCRNHPSRLLLVVFFI